MAEHPLLSEHASLRTVFAEVASFAVALRSDIQNTLMAEGGRTASHKVIDDGLNGVARMFAAFEDQREADEIMSAPYGMHDSDLIFIDPGIYSTDPTSFRVAVDHLDRALPACLAILGRERVAKLFADAVNNVAHIPAAVPVDAALRRNLYQERLNAQNLGWVVP